MNIIKQGEGDNTQLIRLNMSRFRHLNNILTPVFFTFGVENSFNSQKGEYLCPEF